MALGGTLTSPYQIVSDRADNLYLSEEIRIVRLEIRSDRQYYLINAAGGKSKNHRITDYEHCGN